MVGGPERDPIMCEEQWIDQNIEKSKLTKPERTLIAFQGPVGSAYTQISFKGRWVPRRFHATVPWFVIPETVANILQFLL